MGKILRVTPDGCSTRMTMSLLSNDIETQSCGPKATIVAKVHNARETMLTTGSDPCQHGPVQCPRGRGQMILPIQCRERATECRQMSEAASSVRVRDILIDMARTWERLALETEHSAPRNSPNRCCARSFDGKSTGSRDRVE